MINIISYPPIADGPISGKAPIPVSDCMQWIVQPAAADVVTTAGTRAFVRLIFNATFSALANGTAFKIWSRSFTVNATPGYTASSFSTTDGEGGPVRANFADMIEANAYFNDVTVTRIGLYEVRLDWPSCEALANFSGANTALSTLSAIATITSANGTSPVYVPGYQMTASLMKYIGTQFEGQFKNITALAGISPKRSCTGAGQTSIELMRHAKRTLFTPMPPLNNTYEEEPMNQNIMGRFLLKIGGVFRDTNCQTLTGTAIKTDPCLVINSAFDVDDEYKLRPYWFGHPAGYPPGQSVQKFLTNQPDTVVVTTDTKAWLWMTFNFLDTYPTAVKIILNIIIYKKGTAGVYQVVNVNYNSCEWWQAKQFNVSPGRIFTLSSLASISELDYYEVKADPANSTPTVLANGTEYKKYVIKDDDCQDFTDISFVTPIGGISPLLVELLEKEITQDGTEICVSTPCTTEAATYGGRTLAALRSYEKLTFRAHRNYSTEEVNFFRGFKTSPERWLRVRYGSGWIARKFIPEPGGIKIYQSGEFVDLFVTGYLSDIPTPQGKD